MVSSLCMEDQRQTAEGPEDNHTVTDPNPLDNHLLVALPRADFTSLQPHLRCVPMPLGELLYESGERITQAYFPTTSIISLHYVMQDGASAEIAGVGNEGMLGVSLFMGGDRTSSRALV